MSVLISLLVLQTIGVLEAWHPDVDINRVKLLSNKPDHSYTNQGRNSVGYQFKRSYDYDNHSNRLPKWGKAAQRLHGSTDSPNAIKVHQPREDPRLFYQSASYIEENNKKNINRTVSEIYPGREVVIANGYRSPSLPILDNERLSNLIDSDTYRFTNYNSLCIRCPTDRTIVAKPGSDRVMLQSPALLSCSGFKAPRDASFSTVYGPSFGSLLEPGSYNIIGRITYKNKILKMCKMQVHVMVHNCPLPSYLISQCDERSKLCKFSCRDSSLELQGHSSLTCGDNMGWTKWSGKLPVCRARSWCTPPSPPEHGHLSCKGATIDEGPGMSEGSTCRVRCARGWRWSPRAATVCRRGAWTYDLTCLPKRRRF